MSARLLALFLAASGSLWGAGREFDQIVKAIESHYGVRRAHIPLMGVANLVTKAARPAGTSGFKLAIFEDLNRRQDDDAPAEMDEFMVRLGAGGAARGLTPLVQAHSRPDGVATYIFTGEIGHSTRVLIATFERYQATVIEVQVPMNVLLQLLQSPGHAAQMFGVGNERDER